MGNRKIFHFTELSDFEVLNEQISGEYSLLGFPVRMIHNVVVIIM